ncbi:WhiB family transcriptional regulator [Streptomyces sp. NPDC014991]|uniref:WhiB family transcriptional regulator n=1 Tax=Streptomyces sp. NPDC014991 TaxID=3364935 RepID=UPI0036FC11A3
MLYDPERKYLKHAICKGPRDHEIFFAEVSAINREPPKEVQKAWDRAKVKCGYCPVKAQCRRDTLGEAYGVWGGLDPFERWRVRQALAAAVKRWPRERRLRWGEELHRLRTGGTVFREIQRMTGIPETPAMYLIREWERHLAEMAAQEPAPVVELKPLELEPGAADSKPPFPETDGRRHLWARSNGIVRDCWYVGQTEDGLWVFVLIDGRGRRYSSRKWIRAEDVRIYNPQAVVVREYANRPDRQRKAS